MTLQIHHRLLTYATARSLLVLCAFALCVQASSAQDIDADAAAAFEKMVTSHRERPALGVKTTITVELTQGDMTSSSDEVVAEFLFGKNRKALITLRGYQCLLSEGELIGLHEGNAHSYYRGTDDGSPYYALFNAFLDLPFPHLAIFIGEDSMEDLYMQIQPSAPNLQPTGVTTVEIDGTARRVLTLASDDASFEMMIDPETQLIDSAILEITGGPMVQQGVTMRYEHAFEYEVFDNPAPAERFELKTKGRQRVTMLATLQPPPPAPIDPGAAPGMPGRAALAGQPAPEFTLATIDGGAVDLGELRGQIVVIDFWATWCGPCIKALPILHDVATWARDEQLPVKIFAINTFEGATLREDTPDGRLKKAKNFWNNKKFTLPVLMDYTDQTAASYGVSGIPTTVIIRADGVVHTAHTGLSPNYAEQLKADIKAALEAVESQPE